MARLTGIGTPTRKTIGALGDIYTDTKTGKEYKCTFSYRSSEFSDFDCEWKYIGQGTVQKNNMVEKIVKTPEKPIAQTSSKKNN